MVNRVKQSGTTGAALDSLFELTVLLGAHMERSLAERGLTRARAAVIWRLHRSGPLVQAQLSKALEVTPRYITALLDALQSEGLAVRENHPTDRRATLVSLTAAGADVALKLRADHEAFAADLFADLSTEGVQNLQVGIGAVLRKLRGLDTAR